MGLRPRDAGVGNALPINERLPRYELLRAFHEIAFEHYAEDVAISRGDLPGNIAAHQALAPMVLVAVGVAAVDHDAGLQASGCQLHCCCCNALGGVVHELAATSQDDVA